jgi:predicted amidophosphoribosyltransferase
VPVAADAGLAGPLPAPPHAPQSERSAEQRRDNLFDAFGTRLSPPTRLTVMDDVMTTGSTVMEIAETLRLAGARDVRVWVCARVP